MAEGFSRAEAARYLGFRSVEGVRHLQKAGRLRGVLDENGHYRFELEELERLKSDRQQHGMPGRLTKRELSRNWDRDESDAEFDQWLAERVCVRQKQEELCRQYLRTVAEFESTHFDSKKARAALGDIDICSFRELVRRGLLREVVPPERPDGVVDGEVGTGPFFERNEVLALRREMLDGDERLPAHEMSEDRSAVFDDTEAQAAAGLLLAVVISCIGNAERNLT